MASAQAATGCCVVGGGPAGMVLGLLLARAGVAVTVLEKHADFLRDFRGDTVHPSTLRLLDELGLGEAFDRLPARQIERLSVVFDAGTVEVVDLTRLPGRRRYVALVPQWDFLDFLADASRPEPAYTLVTEAEVVDLLRDERGAVCGLRYRHGEDLVELRTPLVVGCDGRDSTVRDRSGLAVRSFGTPMDVEWFRLPRRSGDPAGGFARFRAGALLVLIDRSHYYQAGYLIPKGSDAALRAAGLDAFRERVSELLPWMSDRLVELGSLDEVKLLQVRLSRLRRWYADGVLCIGDAAHAMSPVGGVGINLAIQDAVAAARILADPLRRGVVAPSDLRRVQRRRRLPTILTQGFQRLAHRNFRFDAAPVEPAVRLPLVLRLWKHAPALHVIPAYLLGIGVRPEHAPGWARRPAPADSRPAPHA
ncbi:MAG: FAD-dependent oxidoreductase [Actinomycetes bacterium]